MYDQFKGLWGVLYNKIFKFIPDVILISVAQVSKWKIRKITLIHLQNTEISEQSHQYIIHYTHRKQLQDITHDNNIAK